MKKKDINSKHLDSDNPELTLDELRRARPASEVLPGLIGQSATNELLTRSRGRPAKEDRKVSTTVRLDSDVLQAFQQDGRGWQTRINKVLRENMPKRQKVR